MTTLTLKRKKQVFTVNDGKIADPSAKPEKPASKPAKKPKAKAEKSKKQPQPLHPERIPALIENWPNLFTPDDSEIKPLKIGIFEELVAEELVSKSGLRKGIKAYISRPAYWQKIIDHDCRYDKDGQPSGAIKEKNKEHSKNKIRNYQLWQQSLEESQSTTEPEGC